MIDQETVVKVFGVLSDTFEPEFIAHLVVAMNESGFDTEDKLGSLSPQQFQQLGAMAAVRMVAARLRK